MTYLPAYKPLQANSYTASKRIMARTVRVVANLAEAAILKATR